MIFLSRFLCIVLTPVCTSEDWAANVCQEEPYLGKRGWETLGLVLSSTPLVFWSVSFSISLTHGTFTFTISSYQRKQKRSHYSASHCLSQFQILDSSHSSLWITPKSRFLPSIFFNISWFDLYTNGYIARLKSKQNQPRFNQDYFLSVIILYTSVEVSQFFFVIDLNVICLFGFSLFL